jgi:hypothetical protein
VKHTIAGLLVVLSLSFGIFEDLESGTRAEGMAGAFTAVADDACAIHYNPAGLSQLHRISVYTYYKLLYGGLGENLHNGALNGTIPLPNRFGTVGISLQDMGFVLDNERCLTVSHGFGLFKDLNFGYSLAGYSIGMKDLGQAFAVGIDVGLHARLYRRWTVGFFAHNLNMPQFGKDDKTYLPRLLDFGIAYTPVTGITSSLDAAKEVGKATRIAFGQEFQIVENLLTLRAGVQTEPVRFSFGLGTGTGNIRLDYALLTHADLPLTHNVGLSIVF